MKKLHILHVGKKRLTTVFSLGVAALLIAYITHSVLSWRAYTANYKDWQQVSTRSLAAAIERPLSEKDSKERKLDDIDRLVAQLRVEADSLCELPFTIKWQQAALSNLTSRVKACEAALLRVGDESTRITTLLAHVRLETRIASSVERAVAATNNATTADTWMAARDAWRTASVEIHAIQSDSAGNGFRNDIVDQVKRIESAWQSLVSADEVQDQQALAVAREAVSKEYDVLAQILRDKSEELLKI